MSLSQSLSRCSVQSASTTRILVLPVGGPMPRAVWEGYLSDLRRLGSCIATSNLTYHAPSKDTPFKTINWKKGRMWFEFIDGAAPEAEAHRAQLTLSPPPIVSASSSGSYTDSDTDSDNDDSDPTSAGASTPRVSCPSSLTLSYDWDELLVYKKIMAVICLCYCPTARGWTAPVSAASAASPHHAQRKAVDTSPLAGAFEQFTGVRASLLHPGGPFIYKCYAFEGSPAECAEKREHWAWFPSTQLSGAAASAASSSSASPLASSSADDAQLQSHWEFFLQTCLYDLAAGLLDNFEASIKKLSPNADLKSPLEAAAGGVGLTSAALLSGGSSSSSAAAAEAIQARNKKVRPGRQKKYVGDYCLLAADPVSALKHFKASADLAKSAADPIWHACALVGVADCFAAMGGLEGSDAMDSPAFLDMVVELYEESLSLLSRVPYASLLSIENSFKLARYFLAWGKRCESADVILRMYELKMDCSAHDQISLAIEAAILCHTLGFRRKFGFFLVQAAGLYRELHQSASCHALLKMATPVFRIDGFTRSVLSKEFMQQAASSASAASASEAEQLAAAGDPAELALWARTFPLSPAPAESMLKFLRGSSSGGNAGASADRRAERGFRSGGLRWVFIQKSLLEHLIFSAKQMQDELLTAGCTSYLLRTLHPWLDAAYQSSIISDLWAAARNLPLNLDSIEMEGLPVLHYLRPLPILEENKSWVDPNPGGESQQQEQEQEQEGAMGSAHRLSRAEEAVGGDVFLSRPDDDDVPLSKRKPHRLRFVAGEPLDVEVFLSNPLKVPLLLQRVSLSTSGVEFEPFSASITLAPETACQRILLSGLPKAPGKLCIRGVHIRAFNLLQEHKVTAVGQGLRPLYDDLSNSSYCAAVLCTEHPVSVSDLEIVAALPKLSVSYSMTGNMHQGLLLGERRRAWLLVHNVGPLAVDDLELKAEALFLAGSAQAQSSYYNNPDEIEEIKANTALRDAAALAATGGLPSVTRKNSTPLKSARGASSEDVRSPTRKLTADAALKRLHSPSHSSISSSSHGASSSVSSHPLPAAAVPHPPKRLLVTFDPAILSAALPLRPGCLLRIPLDLSAHVDCCGARFVLSYAESKSSRNFRATTLPISWKVESGLELRNLHVEHFVSPARSSSGSSAAGIAPPSLTTAAFSPAAAASLLTPATHLSSELAELTADDCMLILELTNHSASASFRLACTVDGAPYKTHSVLIDKQCDKRLILPLPRMSFGDAAADRYLRRLAQATEADPSASTASAKWQHDARYKALLARFHERVKLTWTSSDESHGVLVGPGSGDAASCDPASPADVSPVQLAKLLPDPVRFEATLTPLGAIDDAAEEDPEIGSPVFRSPQPSASAAASASSASTSAPPLPVLSSGTRALVGRFHLLRVCARNVSSEPLRLSLTIHPFQEAVNGHWDTEILRSSLLVGGSLTRVAQTLAPGQEASLEIQVAFTAVGRFQFQFVATQYETNAAEEMQAPIAAATAAASVSSSDQKDADPFALLESLAQSFLLPSTAASSSSSFALAVPASQSTPPLPSPIRTVRRRSMLPSDAAEMTSAADAFHAAAAAAEPSGMESTMQRAASQRAQFKLDVESDSEAEEDEPAAAAAASTVAPAAPSAAPPSLCYRCQDLMVVQACLQ